MAHGMWDGSQEVEVAVLCLFWGLFCYYHCYCCFLNLILHFRIQNHLKMKSFFFLNLFGCKIWRELLGSCLFCLSHLLWILIRLIMGCWLKYHLGCDVIYNTPFLKYWILSSKTNLAQGFHIREGRTGLLWGLICPVQVPARRPFCKGY